MPIRGSCECAAKTSVHINVVPRAITGTSFSHRARTQCHLKARDLRRRHKSRGQGSSYKTNFLGQRKESLSTSVSARRSGGMKE
jgi:hypothetical protein